MSTLAAISAILFDSAIKASVILLAAWCGALLLKKLSAAMRHTVLACAVVAVLLLPFSSLLPAWHVPGLPSFMSSEASTTNPGVKTQHAASQTLATAVPSDASTSPINAASRTVTRETVTTRTQRKSLATRAERRQSRINSV